MTYDKKGMTFKELKEAIDSGRMKAVFDWDSSQDEIGEASITEAYERRDKDIEFILRNKIDKPIKGEITKNKLRWRGIDSLCYDCDHKFLGVIQRNKAIGIDGLFAVFDKHGRNIL